MPEFKTDHYSSTLPISATAVPRIGRLAGSNSHSDVLVEVEGCGPIAAKLVANLDRRDLAKNENRGREVLLLFEQGDSRRPIIVALMEDRLESLISFDTTEEPESLPEEAIVDGKKIVIEAEREIVLRCGRGSIQIREDGKIVIRGTELLSRSSGSNRIRGASVGIN